MKIQSKSFSGETGSDVELTDEVAAIAAEQEAGALPENNETSDAPAGENAAGGDEGKGS